MSGETEISSATQIMSEEQEETRESDARADDCGLIHSPPAEFPLLASSFDTGTTYPWTKWVDSLRMRRRDYQPATCVNGWFDGPSINRESLEDSVPSLWEMKSWDQVSGGSSILGTVKTASMSVPASIAPRSRTNTITSSSIVLSRQSMESNRSSIYDTTAQVAKAMAIKRRHVLREIYISEIHYVDGLQTMVQILSTYLTMRPAILHDLERLYDMHDVFKIRLESVSPLSAEDLLNVIPNRRHTIIQKIQHQSLLKRNLKRRVDSQVGADPSEALLVAREIDKLTTRFDLYEAYIRSFDVLSEDIAILRQGHPAEGFWTEGIEALQKSVHSTQRRKENHKKSMTLEDLIAKPVQRVCKYRLLLSELLRATPEINYPLIHSKIKKILDRNIQAVDRINTVVGDPNFRIRIRKTIALHDRLDYGDQIILENVYQELGPLILCGVLHVTYNSSTGIAGQYLVCALFPSYLILAKSRSDCRKISLVASIYLSDMIVDGLVNGQGLACLNTPFSWKVIFQHDQKHYEFIFSASSAAEERSWKTEILKTSVMPPNEVPTISLEPRKFSFIVIPLKALESDGRSLLLKRRSSLRILSPRSDIKQQQDLVIIKKTHNPLYDNEVRLLHEAELTRFRSVAKRPVCTPTILMPARSCRVKLERSIADIFSQDILPYPGMTLGRSDYIQSQTMIRKSVMRGLSLRGVFSSRRSVSFNRVASVFNDNESGQSEHDKQAKELEIIKTTRASSEATSEKKDKTEENAEDTKPKTSKTTFNSIRQRLTRTVSNNNVTDEVSGTKPKSKSQNSWKKWPSHLSMFSFFDTTNQTHSS